MKKIRETLVHAAVFGALSTLAVPAVQAAVMPLQNAVVTATYNGDGASMLGLDHGFASEAGSNTTGLDPSGTGVEFFTADALFGFDFGADGSLTIYNNAPIPTGPYAFRFDFGTSLAAPLASFTLASMAGAAGTPLLSVLDGGHALGLDLTGVNWDGGFGTISAQIAAQASAGSVPEPRSAALLLGGFGAMLLARRRKAN
jgi:hypothetical protein